MGKSGLAYIKYIDDAHPEHPIVIPPDSIGPGVPTHPIVIPPVYPSHPIVIPPDSIEPGVPAHPIVIPPEIWGPAGPWPTPPIYLPPEGGGPRPEHPIAGTEPHPEHPIVVPPAPPVSEDAKALVLIVYQGEAVWFVVDPDGQVKPPTHPTPKPSGKGSRR